MCYLVHAPPVQLQERALMWTRWVRKPWGPYITFYSSHHPKGKSLGTCPAESGQTSDRATCLQSLVHMCAHTPHTNTWTWSSALHTEKKPSRNADMSTAWVWRRGLGPARSFSFRTSCSLEFLLNIFHLSRENQMETSVYPCGLFWRPKALSRKLRNSIPKSHWNVEKVWVEVWVQHGAGVPSVNHFRFWALTSSSAISDWGLLWFPLGRCDQTLQSQAT